MNKLYFDHAATTPPYEEVIGAVGEVMRTYYGNPSSLHGAGGEAQRLLKQAAEVIAAGWRVRPDNLVFTSGGTESNNLAIFGVVRAFANRGRHLITTRIEHPSVYECFRQLERSGYEVTYLDADETGVVRAEAVRAALRDDTMLVSMMHVNNETGRIQPVEQVGALLASLPRVVFHVDAVQAAGKLPLAPAAHGIDLMSVSAHKFHGPKGAGALYIRSGLKIAPLLLGGGQQGGFRSGTENVPLIVGMAKALRMASDQLASDRDHLYTLRRLLCGMLAEERELIRVTGTKDEGGMAPHIVHFVAPGLRAEVFLHAMEQEGFLVSSQSACSSGDKGPSRVLLAMGFSDEEARCGIRVSLSRAHTAEDVKRLADAAVRTARQFRQWME